MERRLIWYGESILTTVSKAVDEINDDIKVLIDDMFEVMQRENGIGLAAIQIGVAKRILVVEILRSDNENTPEIKMAMINPIITEKSDELMVDEEGCLSLPEIREDVARSRYIKVDYTDVHGQKQSIEAENLFARVIQHEMDHLDGIVFTDRIEDHHKRRIKKDLRDLKRESRRRAERFGDMV